MARKPPRRAAPPVMLGANLGLMAAGPLAADLLARRGQDLGLDASGVTRLGGQCLQVLLSARATWQADGHAFTVVAASPEFTETSALLGAADLAARQEA